MPAVKVNLVRWRFVTSRPGSLPDGIELGEGKNGIIFHGSKGKLVCGNYGSNYRCYRKKNLPNLSNRPKQYDV